MPAELSHQEHGPSGAPLVALVHGSMDRAQGMAAIARRLDDRFRVLRYDRRGYAKSLAVGPPYTVDQHASDLSTLLGGRPAVVFGHSFGGDVALAAASRHPEAVAAVVVFEAPMSWEPWWPDGQAGSMAVRVAESGGDPGDIAEHFLRVLAGDQVWERLPQATRRERRAEGVALVGELTDLRKGPPYEPSGVTMPVVVARGERCRPHHRLAASTLVERLPNAVGPVVVEGAGHGVHRSHPAQAAALVLEAVRLAGGPWTGA